MRTTSAQPRRETGGTNSYGSHRNQNHPATTNGNLRRSNSNSPSNKNSSSTIRVGSHRWYFSLALAGIFVFCLVELRIQYYWMAQGDCDSLDLNSKPNHGLPLRGTTHRDPPIPSEFEFGRDFDPQFAAEWVCETEYQRLIDGRTPGLTPHDVLRSTMYRGNRYRLVQLVHKLNGFAKDTAMAKDITGSTSYSKPAKPITAVVCGGSISVGHGVAKAYAQRLQEWFNDKYPLETNTTHQDRDDDRDRDQDDGRDTETETETETATNQHTVINKGTHGADICAMAKRTNQIMDDLGPDVDLFILEFAVNDYQGQDHITQVENKMDTFFDGFERIAECTETVVVKLLTHYPAAAIVFLEMRSAAVARKSGALLHLGAAQHYQVPVISYEHAIWPEYWKLLQLLQPYRYSRPTNETVLPFPHGCHECDRPGMEDDEMRDEGCESVCGFQQWLEPDLECEKLPPGREPCYVPFLAHDEVHPSGIGHGIATDLIVDAIAATQRDLCQQRYQQRYQPQPRSKEEQSESSKSVPPSSLSSSTLLDNPAVLPTVGWMVQNPLLLDAKTDFVWVNDTYIIFDEALRDLNPSSHTPGFELLEDLYDRWGWIATNEAGKESITFEISLPTTDTAEENTNSDKDKEGGCYIPYLSVLKSYENMGIMTVTIADHIKEKATSLVIDSLWEPRISVPHDVQLLAKNDLKAEHEEGCSGRCSITVTSHHRQEGRGGNKIKIVTLSVRPCVPKYLIAETMRDDWDDENDEDNEEEDGDEDNEEDGDVDVDEESEGGDEEGSEEEDKSNE